MFLRDLYGQIQYFNCFNVSYDVFYLNKLIVVLCDVFPLLKIQMLSLLAERSKRVTNMPILLSGKFTVALVFGLPAPKDRKLCRNCVIGVFVNQNYGPFNYYYARKYIKFDSISITEEAKTVYYTDKTRRAFENTREMKKTRAASVYIY